MDIKQLSKAMNPKKPEKWVTVAGIIFIACALLSFCIYIAGTIDIYNFLNK